MSMRINQYILLIYIYRFFNMEWGIQN